MCPARLLGMRSFLVRSDVGTRCDVVGRGTGLKNAAARDHRDHDLQLERRTAARTTDVTLQSTALSIMTDTFPPSALPVSAEVVAIPATPRAPELEVIGEFTVHPYLSEFPLIIGKEFDELVASAARTGRLIAVETHNGQLIDGRIRVLIRDELRRRRVEIDLPVVEWTPSGDETVEDHIWVVNGLRRHLTADQRAALCLKRLSYIQSSCRARQEASRFGNRSLTAAAANETSPPDGAAPSASRTSREKDAASSVGQFCALANIGLHTGRQAMALARGIEKGTIDPSERDAVIAGEKSLRAAVRGTSTSTRRKARKHGGDVYEPEEIFHAEPSATEEEVRRRWERLKCAFAITDHREVRRLLRSIITEEQRQFDL